MKIRAADNNDLNDIRQLFYQTITTINVPDYNPEQIFVWASGYNNIDSWQEKIRSQHFFVAEIDQIITGFGSVTDEGYVDYLFTHKDYQRQGIATELLKQIELFVSNLNQTTIWADVSITAVSFFLKRGFTISKVYKKKVGDTVFDNTIMEKQLA
jgi:putative acetyltransferase